MLSPNVFHNKPRKPSLLEMVLSYILRGLPIKHGAHRILDRLRPTRWGTASSLVELKYSGSLIKMDISDLVGWHFFILKSFDPEVTEIIVKFSAGDHSDVFWDIGANKGACSYQVASSLPLAKIVAIEPQQVMKSLLENNLNILARGRHQIMSVGVGEIPGYFKIVIPCGNRGRASLVHNDSNDQNITEEIQIITAEDIRKQSGYGWPTLIKIDVEGFEPSVIKSLEGAFKCRKVRSCVFECHPTEINGFEAIRASTEKFGYRIFAITKTAFTTGLIPVLSLVSGSTDYVIVRNDLCK